MKAIRLLRNIIRQKSFIILLLRTALLQVSIEEHKCSRHKSYTTVDKRLLSIVTCFLLIILFSCSGRTVYNTYTHTLINGWEKNDTLFYEVPKLEHTGFYNEELALRINRAYPFKGVTIIVNQRVIPGGMQYTDTINCKFDTRDGIQMARGISYFQYSFPVNRRLLQKGDSIVVSIHHNMKRDILPGISDVGLKISQE